MTLLSPNLKNFMIRKSENSGVTEITPAECVKTTFNIGETEYTNICADYPEFSKEIVTWGSLEWSAFLFAIFLIGAIGYKFHTKK